MAARASPSESGSERRPPARGAEPPAGQAGGEELTFGLDEVLAAVQSLYYDQVRPCGRVILRRLREHAAEAFALSAGLPADASNVESVPWVDPERLRGLCEGSPRLRVKREQGREYSVTIVGMRDCFVDASNDEDVYPEAFWAQLTEYILALQGDDIRLPGGRYACARELLRRGVPCLAGLSLGQVCRIVQVAIARRRILGHLHSDLVPFPLSEEWAREQAALHRQPRASGQPRAHQDLPLATFDDVRAGLMRLLHCGKKEPRNFSLGNMKKLFRLHLGLELSETALGYPKLYDVLHDPRLSDICSVHARGQSAFMIKPKGAQLRRRATTLKVPPVPAGQDLAPAAPLQGLPLVDCRPPSPDFANPPAWGCDCSPDGVASGGQGLGSWSDLAQCKEGDSAPGAAEATADAGEAGLHLGSPQDGEVPLAWGLKVCVKNTFVHVDEEDSDDEDLMIVSRSKSLGQLGTAARRVLSASTSASDDEGVDERAASGDEQTMARMELAREPFATKEHSLSVKNTFVHFADVEDDSDDEDSPLLVHRSKTLPHHFALGFTSTGGDDEGTRLQGADAVEPWPLRRAPRAEIA